MRNAYTVSVNQNLFTHMCVYYSHTHSSFHLYFIPTIAYHLVNVCHSYLPNAYDPRLTPFIERTFHLFDRTISRDIPKLTDSSTLSQIYCTRSFFLYIYISLPFITCTFFLSYRFSIQPLSKYEDTYTDEFIRENVFTNRINYYN